MDDETLIEPKIFSRHQARPEQDALLPGLNTAYKASGTVDGEVSRLVLVMGKDGFRPGNFAYVVFQYVHIGLGEFGATAGGAGDGQVFRFVFSDIQPKRVTVHGRNLMRIFDYISLRRMPWIRQADRDFRAVSDEALDNDPIITRIQVEEWKPPERP